MIVLFLTFIIEKKVIIIKYLRNIICTGIGQIESVDGSIVFVNTIESFSCSWFLIQEIYNTIVDFNHCFII